MKKEDTINFLLNSFMDVVITLPPPQHTAVRYAISACFRFIAEASFKLGVSYEEIYREFKKEWNDKQNIKISN